jgi:hypothetical protein
LQTYVQWYKLNKCYVIWFLYKLWTKFILQ